MTKDSVQADAVAWNTKKNYQYKPSVKIMGGAKEFLSGAGKDYILSYENNDQLNVTKYIQGEADAKIPEAVIQLPEKSSYKLVNENGEEAAELRVPLKIYQKALKMRELYVIVEEPVYTGKQLKPAGKEVNVYVGTAEAVKAAEKAGEQDEKALTDSNGKYRLTKLTENTDYVLDYGNNITAGKNKGKLIIIGNSKKYGGSVTVKFTILNRNI